MSKRESNPKVPVNSPEPKKQKVRHQTVDNSNQGDKAVEQQRPDSPIPGPSSAPSDPQLRALLPTGLIPICRYSDLKLLEEASSQGSTSTTDAAASTSATDTTNSTNVEVGDSRAASVEDMDVDSEATTTTTTTSESSTSTAPVGRPRRRRGRRNRKHQSRRDQ